MQKLYVLGHPIAHSKSPVMHNAAYQALGLNWVYGSADIESADDAAAFVARRDFLGINITTPYKPLALACAHTASPAASLAKGANVLVNTAEGLAAHNTDGFGCVTYLQRAGAHFAGVRVVVCGTGPTALSIAGACMDAGAEVLVLGRDAARAQAAVERWRHERGALCPESADVGACEATGESEGAGETREGATREGAGACHVAQRPCPMEGSSYTKSLARIPQASIVIDATPLGMKRNDPAPFDTTVLREGQLVFDTVYGHGQTALAAAAANAGCTFLSGGGMLVGQAVAAAQLFLQAAGEPDTLGFEGMFDVMAQAAGFDI